MFVTHFPGQEELLDGWDAATVVRDEAHRQVTKKIQSEVSEQLDIKLWIPDCVLRAFDQYMLVYERRAGAGASKLTPSLTTQSDRVIWRFLAEGAPAMANFWISRPATSLYEADQLKAEFEMFFDSIVTSSEMRCLDDAYSQLAGKRSAVVGAMKSIINRDEIYGRCPICERLS
jgi:hypothetical protein